MMFRDAAVHVKAANGDVGKFMDMWSKGLLKNEEVMAAVIKSSDAVDAKWAKRLPLISEGWTLVNNAHGDSPRHGIERDWLRTKDVR